MLARLLRPVLFAWLWLLHLPAAHGQGRLNLGLEPGANHGQPLALWSQTVPVGGRLAFDSTTFWEGRGSLRLDLPDPEEGPRAAYLATGVVPPDSVRGQLLTVSMWVRTQGWRGQVQLGAWATALTVAGLTTESVTAVDSLPGTTAWRRLTLRLPVKATAFALGLRLSVRGSGRVWLDHIQLLARGRPVPDYPVPATGALLLPLAESLVPNWDFERPLPPTTQPDPAEATAQLDSAGPQHGRRYLRLTRRSAPGQPAPAVYLGSVRLDKKDGGKTLRIMGYWRRPGVSGAAGPAPVFACRLLTTGLRAQGRWWADTLGLKQALPPPGPQWTAFALEAPIQLQLFGHEEPTDFGALSLGLLLPGAGTVELDNVSFAIDGRPYVPTGPPAQPAPSPAETAWLRATARPLRLGPPATEAADLAALGTALALASARLVGVGEVTHGSHGIFALHNKLIRYLIGQKGFTGLALEASPVACAALTDYVRTGRGDPARLLAALDGWPAAELLDLVRWLRAYQQAHPATPLLVAGLDVQQPELPLAALGQLVAADDDFAQTRLRQLARLLAAYPHPADEDPDLRHAPDQPHDLLLAPLRRLVAELGAGLDTRAKLRNPVSLALLARQRYYLRLVEQGATWRRLSFGLAFNYRQACLAENAQYLSQTEGPAGAPARLVLWASNSAVAKALGPQEHPMGEWLRATLGTGYAALGLALGQGSYAALDAAGHWRPAPLATPPPGAYEAWLRTGPPASWLGLSRLELTDENAWLFQSQLLRDPGRPAARNQFMLHSLRGEFDAVVFLRDSTPAYFFP